MFLIVPLPLNVKGCAEFVIVAPIFPAPSLSLSIVTPDAPTSIVARMPSVADVAAVSFTDRSRVSLTDTVHY